MNILRNKNKLKIVPILVTLVIFTLAPKFSFALTKAEIDAQKRAKQDELARLNQQIQAYKGQIADKQKQAASLSNEISLYNIQIAATETQIQATSTNIDNTNLQIEEVKQQIQDKTNQIEQEKQILAELILTLDQYDNSSALEIGLGSQNFSSFMDQVQYTESVQNQVYSLLQQIKAIKAKLQDDQKDLESNLQKLQQLNDQLQTTQSTLNSQKTSKQQLLDQTRGSEKNYQKLLKQTQDQEDKINKEIEALNQQGQGSNINKLKPVHGILAWPMDGVITQGYGNTGFTDLGYNFHNGIDVAAPAGTPIYAAADGVVLATGKGEYAYGNWVAIKHTITSQSGHQIITLYGHMVKFVVHSGQTVSRGTLIGYEGNTGNTTRLTLGPSHGYHLHFTVFDAQGFKITPGAYGNYSVPNGYTYNPKDFL